MSKSQDRLNALAEEVASRLIEQLEKRHCTLAKALERRHQSPAQSDHCITVLGRELALSANGCRNARVF